LTKKNPRVFDLVVGVGLFETKKGRKTATATKKFAHH